MPTVSGLEIEVLEEMELVINALLAGCVIILPLFAHRMSWKPASFFAVVSATYAFFGAFYLLETRFCGTELTSENSGLSDTYYVVSYGYSYLNMALFMLIPTALLWLQARLKAILFPRSTIGLFWALNLGSLSSVVAVKTLMSIVMPKRYDDYEAIFIAFNLIAVWSTFIVQAAIGLLVLLFIASVFLRSK